MIEAAIFHRHDDDVLDARVRRIGQSHGGRNRILRGHKFPGATGPSEQGCAGGEPGAFDQVATIYPHDHTPTGEPGIEISDTFRGARGWEKDEGWRINHPEKLAIGCKPERKR